MQRSNQNAQTRTFQVIKTTAVIASLSLGLWNRPEAAIAQTSQVLPQSQVFVQAISPPESIALSSNPDFGMLNGAS